MSVSAVSLRWFQMVHAESLGLRMGPSVRPLRPVRKRQEGPWACLGEVPYRLVHGPIEAWQVANVTSTPKPTPTRQDSKLLGMSTYVAELGHATFRVLKDVECLSLRWHSFVTSICGDMTQNKSAGEDLEAFGPPSEVSCHQ